MDRGELEGLDRESLVVKAQAAGIRRARILTRPELIDELLRLDPTADEQQLRKSRGFFGRARDLVARVVERGLHLPDAADRIRTLALGTVPAAVPRTEPQAMPTVTLAEIYAAQGYRARAIETLRRVLEREPDHAAAQALLARLEDEAYVTPAPRLPPEPDVEPEPATDDDEDDGYVDAHATTDVFEMVPERVVQRAQAEAEAEAEADAEAQRIEPSIGAPSIEELDEVHDEAHDCFAIPLPRDDAGGRMYARWNVSWGAIGALLGARPNGRFVVRAHIVMPAWDGPSTETRDLIVDPDDGEAVLRALPEPSVVRVAVGWLEGSTFVPLAHSPALEMGRDRRLVIWTTTGCVPVTLDDPRAAPIARALEASRRAARAHG